MGDRIVVMNHGVLQQAGSPEELYMRPRNLFVAGFIGSPAMNLVPAEKLNGSGSGRIAGFRPEHVEVGLRGGEAIQLTGRVEVREYLGDEQLVHLVVKDTPILAKLPVEEHVSPGDEVSLSIARDKIHLFDAESGERVNA